MEPTPDVKAVGTRNPIIEVISDTTNRLIDNIYALYEEFSEYEDEDEDTPQFI